MPRGTLTLDSFRLGQRADGALRDDRLLSLRRLKNFDIIYTDGRLRMRKGYDRFNATELAGSPTQLFHYRMMTDPDTDHVLCIANDLWYKVAETGAHTQISDEAATAPRPVVQFGDRVFFGTDGDGSDIGFRWTDDTAIGTGDSYRVGIEPPDNPPNLSIETADGRRAAGDIGVILNSTNTRRIGIPFQLRSPTAFSEVFLRMFRSGLSATKQGAIRVAIYTDVSGEPSTVLVDEQTVTASNAVSEAVNVRTLSFDPDYAYVTFRLRGQIDFLDTLTPYWIVLEGDSDYYTNYLLAGGESFYVALRAADIPPAATFGEALAYNTATSLWESGLAAEAIFYVGRVAASIEATTIAFVDSDPDTITDSANGFLNAGLKDGDTITVTGAGGNNGDYTIDTAGAGALTLVATDSLTNAGGGPSITIVATNYYEYLMTFVNSSYLVESRPSDPLRIQPTQAAAITTINVPVSMDGQVDRVRIYRRELGSGEGLFTLDSDILDTYKFILETNEGAQVNDGLPTGGGGAELQTEDHYGFDYFDPADDSYRSESLQPNVAVSWKSRIWFAEENANILYMSKILVENGATGLVGDAIPDYFPLENRLEMPVPSGIIALKTISDDMMAIYFEDESIWVIWGANDVQNPPSDIRIDDKTPSNGLIGTTAIDRIEGRHIIMTRDGVYAFHPSGLMEFLSETNQSIIDAIETANLETSVIRVYGNEIWCLIDDDNDGAMETILILDMQRDLATRQLHDRAWRTYDYGVDLNDIIVRKSGGTFRTLLAASADDNYILELNTGNTDNGSPILAEAETHDLRMPDRVKFHDLAVAGDYETTPPLYEVFLRDHLGNEVMFELHPTSSDDVRGHRTGVRLVSSPQARARVTMRSVNEDELLSLSIGYTNR